MIQAERIRALNERPAQTGDYVLYWMQQAQRVRNNHALEYAIQQANARDLPVVVVFGLTDRYPEANERHYAFLLEGLQEVEASLRKRGIRFLVLYRSPEIAVVEQAQRAALLVTDCGYLRIQKIWRQRVAQQAPCLVVQVESDVVVPIETASNKEEFAARTLRPKIARLLPDYLVPLETAALLRSSLNLPLDTTDALDLSPTGAVLSRLDTDRSVPRVATFRGGETEALRLLEEFVRSKLQDYDTLRNEPALNHVSNLSPYLHFGQISPLTIALAVQESQHSAGRDAFLEELIVRRELSMNFVHFNPNYDRYEGLPEWARKTLEAHAADPRPTLYTLKELEDARTHDPYWNAAQREMVLTGKMHNYMRMYWGKKILEWTRTPQEGFDFALFLNNKYELDGRDANSFTGVAWCFGKHDRPWAERPIFGMVRYMNAAGLQRKLDIEAYVRKIESLYSASSDRQGVSRGRMSL
jgi:deoxyribodipyrimidine photo-lyase